MQSTSYDLHAVATLLLTSMEGVLPMQDHSTTSFLHIS